MREKLPSSMYAAAFLGLSLILFVLVLEVLLRTSPSLFSPGLLNYAFSRYGTFPGGMYFNEPLTEALFMRPEFRTTASWNGYFWTHQTDAHGFRNPEIRHEKKILLFGDSLVYGHGVEQEQTAAHILRSKYGREVYNMSRQGDALYQHYVLLRLYLEEFHPDTVILFFFLNDFFDVETARTAAQLEETPEIGDFDYQRIRLNLSRLGKAEGFSPLALVYRSAALRLLKGLVTEGLSSSPAKAHAAPGGALPAYLEPFGSVERFTAIAGYYRRVLADLNRRFRAGGTKMILVNLSLGRVLPESARPALEKAHAFLMELSQELHVDYFDTREILLGCEGCFLKNDGHFSAEGHRVLAEFLHREVLATPGSSDLPPEGAIDTVSR